jgi:hypothetical protein
MREITQEQLDEALSLQKSTQETKLGHILIELGYTDNKSVLIALTMQEKIRSGDRAGAELDLLDFVTAEAAETAKELTEAIAARRTTLKQQRISTGCFFMPITAEIAK